MARVLRGDVLWADLDPVIGREQGGRRPVVVLSKDIFNERSGTVIAVSVTSQPQRVGFPLVLQLTSGNLPKRSWVKIGHVRTISVERLHERLGRISRQELHRIVEGLNDILDE